MVRVVALLLILMGVSTVCASAQQLPIPSSWQNQSGSELTVFAPGANGGFVGQYVNQATGFDCQNMPFDASGRSGAGNVRFVVTWKNSFKSCNSVAAWTGTLAGNVMTTQWELAYVDPATGRLKIARGNDVFHRTR
ncbi:avidin/streptavidin family protein [Bradyrhizobium sp. OK095]|jgi:hypothetical protein|uniref:avidin/streptavidin family protein n=1 Tax=Bradyrhizobium sp. OK095 TaxID=1882760 RepID=UPI0008D1990E|nr:avidin/streptavidin family protein [Bradyrhizobium sp. OK095]SEM90269.1 Avidin family protein [Bradyrhizobium sp. OK095]